MYLCEQHSAFNIFEGWSVHYQSAESTVLYAHKSYISDKFKGAITEYNEFLQCEGSENEQDPEDITNPLPDPVFAKRVKLLSKPDCFVLFGKMGIDFSSTSELL